MIKHDIEILKQSISYDPDTGEFRRNYASGPPRVGSRNKGILVIRIHRGAYLKTHSAWRVAILLVHGYYPKESDACVFKDGDTFNLKLENLEVLPMEYDELTAHEFARDNGLSYQMVLRAMEGAPAVRRTIDGTHNLYYRMKDYRERFNIEKIKRSAVYQKTRKKRVVHKHNKDTLDFLRTFTLPPVRWEWSLR